MSEPVITNTPRPGDTPEQIAARRARREPYCAPEDAVRPAKLFYLTEPSRGVFVVNLQMKGEHGHLVKRIEISRDQMANFLVDGTAMALRSNQETRKIDQ